MDPLNSRPGSRRQAKFAPDEPPFLITGVTSWRLNVRPHVWRPPTDIYETEDKYVVRVEIAGMGESEFSVTVDNNTLAIRGVRSDTHERRAFQQMEINFGEFAVEVEFPNAIDVEHVDAQYHDGFLTVDLLKAQPKQILIGDNQAE